MKYLDIKTEENLNWKQQISDIAINLNRRNVILSKLRHFTDRKTLKSIYHAIFCYGYETLPNLNFGTSMLNM